MSAEKVCRLCMGRSNLIHCVLEDNLLQKIAICVSVMINPTDTMYPLELCALCALKVKDFFEFRQNCLKVQQLLEQTVSPQQPEEPPPPMAPIMEAVKQEKVEKILSLDKAPAVQDPQITKNEAMLDEGDVVECLNEIPDPEEVSIIESVMDRTTEEFEEISDEEKDGLMDDDLVEQDEMLFETESVAEDERENESDLQTTDDRNMDYHIEMVYEQNPLEVDFDEHEEAASEVEDIQGNQHYQPNFTIEFAQDLQEVDETLLKGLTSGLSRSYPCRVKTRRKNNGPRRSKSSNLSEKEIYQSLLQSCATCGKSVERNRMEGHRNRHLDVRPYTCNADGCGMAFYCKISLRLHTKNRHSTEQLSCDLCGKPYTSKKALYHHRKETHAEKHHACEECGLVFVSNARLNRHKVTHTDQREYKCPHCPKEFYRSNNLKVHIRSHTKEKPFGCELCDKAFGYQRLLREHMSRHH
ncbi:zinc finger protein 311 [Aedes albopictus]|uniref:C2h2-type zn-finger protein n=1 Tax=Aedes albopictus TaxID=7160 RepID=A0ABM1YB25_AEDAL|nr:zinc finger protein 311 [Aedes albopictus]